MIFVWCSRVIIGNMAVSTVTLGEIERCDAVRGLVITRARHAAGLQLVAHEHERANMSIALGGSFFERIGNRVFECGVGSVLVKPSGARHSNAYVSATHSVLLETTDRCLDGLFRDSAHFYSPRFSTAASLRDTPQVHMLAKGGGANAQSRGARSKWKVNV